MIFSNLGTPSEFYKGKLKILHQSVSQELCWHTPSFKFGWFSNAWYLICLRELYLCFQLRLSLLHYTVVWLYNAQLSCFFSCMPGQLRSQRKTRSSMKPNVP